ncbi:MAG TPA: response regulator [Actinomycetota bacterium]|nr:response regulator [Actinomycetota bacterium]
MSREPTQPASPGPPQGGPAPVSRPRILIVEDEADLAWVEQFNLEAEGYEVRVVHEGRTALRALEEFRPHLLLLDVMLPQVDGWSILQRARALPPDRRPRVAVVSAVAGVEEAARVEGVGDAFIPKPFDIEELVRVVKETLRGGR